MNAVHVDEYMVTTIDNPFDYFTQFDAWFQYDTEHNYNTCGYLARIAMVSDELTDVDYAKEVEMAVDEIIKFDFLGLYIKIKKKTSETEEKS